MHDAINKSLCRKIVKYDIRSYNRTIHRKIVKFTLKSEALAGLTHANSAWPCLRERQQLGSKQAHHGMHQPASVVLLVSGRRLQETEISAVL